MATRYSKGKYARVKNLKNEPLSHITPGSKKRKLDEGKDETPTPLSLFGTPSSHMPSLEMMTFSTPTTHLKGRLKLVRVFGRTLLLPLDELATSLLTTNLRVSCPFLPTNWSAAIFTSWCRYFTQRFFITR